MSQHVNILCATITGNAGYRLAAGPEVSYDPLTIAWIDEVCAALHTGAAPTAWLASHR